MSLAASHDLFAIVINWNGGEENLRCLTALTATGVPPERIIFVDNGSTDGAHRRIRSYFPGLIWIQNDTNLGFAPAANQGAARALTAGARWLFFVNNDLEMEAAALQRMLTETAGDPSIGVLAPRILQPGEPARIWAYGGTWAKGLRLVRLVGHNQPDGPKFRATQEADFLTGAALLVRADAWRDAEGFEASYFAYVEDIELSHVLKRMGWRVLLVGGAGAVHHPSSATGGGYSARRKYMMALNTVRFLKRRGSPWAWLLFLGTEVFPWPLLALLAPLLGRGKAAWAKGLGMWHGMIGRRVSAQVVEPGGTPFW